MTLLKQIPCLPLCLLLYAAPALAAPQAAAVVDDGYAGKVLQKILDTGKLKFGSKMRLRLSLDDQGHLLECTASKGADAASACAAAKTASPFGTPPYGVPTYVTLVLWTGQLPKASSPTATAQEASSESASPKSKSGKSSSWLAKAQRDLRNAMYIPAQTKPGTYHVTARIKCEPDGKILDCSILKSSGDKTLDKYCLQGIRRAGKLDPLPAGMSDSFDASFTLTRQ